MPYVFYIACLSVIIGIVYCFRYRYDAWGGPAIVVLLTATFWYIGDALYNDYDSYLDIGEVSLNEAWWQFILFAVVFVLLVKPLHHFLNKNIRVQSSMIMLYLERDVIRHSTLQHKLELIFRGVAFAWVILMLIGVILTKGNFTGLFFPYLSHKVDPWARAQIGGGISAFLSLAGYLQIFLTSALGVLAALIINPRVRFWAVLLCILAMPYFIFDRTRNTMLSTLLPGVLSFVFIYLRWNLLYKIALLGGVLLSFNAWFLFVLEVRSENQSISAAVIGETEDDPEIYSFGEEQESESKHHGLNMFEELAFINAYLRTGAYQPNWGQRYFAELVNPIPRALWKDKPLIGLDYAEARGQKQIDETGTMTATISTGMIGQGVVNFGKFFGPISSALLMALWAALIARQDLLSTHPAHMLLYGVGMILTFNLGRDITLLVMYPFLFGIILMKVWQWCVDHKIFK